MSEPRTIRVLGAGGDYEDWPNPKYKEPSELAPAPGSARSSAFFAADVSEAVDYVLDQSSMYHDQSRFVAAVIQGLKPWKEKAPNND